MNGKVRHIAYWATTILGPASFVIGGVLHLRQTEQVVSTLSHLGYPVYFAPILGIWKLLGAIVIVLPRLPRLKEWAYAGFFFDLTAAAASRAAVGDSAADIAAPLLFLTLVLASWALRPASRMLASPTNRELSSIASTGIESAEPPFVRDANSNVGSRIARSQTVPARDGRPRGLSDRHEWSEVSDSE